MRNLWVTRRRGFELFERKFTKKLDKLVQSLEFSQTEEHAEVRPKEKVDSLKLESGLCRPSNLSHPLCLSKHHSSTLLIQKFWINTEPTLTSIRHFPTFDRTGFIEVTSSNNWIPFLRLPCFYNFRVRKAGLSLFNGAPQPGTLTGHFNRTP